MKILELLKKSDHHFRKNLALFFVSYFLVLFNYSMVRAASTTLFFDAFGAKSSPLAWLWGIIFLALTVMICNKLQSFLSVQKVFLLASGFSSVLFLMSSLGLMLGTKILGFVPFVWKEIYIVIQVHLLLAYANNQFNKDEFKLLIGPIGAIGGIGGMLGGMATKFLSPMGGTYLVMWVGIACVLLPAISFLYTPRVKKDVAAIEHKTPLASLKGDIKKYVALIAGVVTLTQFIINIADFNFNLAFETDIIDSAARTSYLGDVYMWTNFLAFLLQFLLLPLVLPRVSERNFHLFIPISYLVGLSLVLMLDVGGLIPIAALYVYYKASDYSIFSSAKELLYQPLSTSQKFGAKYLTDMLVYRVAKALIAVVLIYLQSSTILNMMMIIFILDRKSVV